MRCGLMRNISLNFCFLINICKGKNHLFTLQWTSSEIFDFVKFLFTLFACFCTHFEKICYSSNEKLVIEIITMLKNYKLKVNRYLLKDHFLVLLVKRPLSGFVLIICCSVLNLLKWDVLFPH